MDSKSLARNFCAKLLPHTTSVSNVDAVAELYQEVERQAAELTELRAQLLSDQGQYIEETGRLREALALAGAFLIAVEGHGYCGMSLYDTAAQAVRSALYVKKSPESLHIPETCKESLQEPTCNDSSQVADHSL